MMKTNPIPRMGGDVLRAQSFPLRGKRCSTIRSCVAAVMVTGRNTMTRLNDASYLGLEEGFQRNFVLGEVIGRGGFGTVHLSACKRDGVKYATKVIPKWKKGVCQLEKIRREVTVWTSVQRFSQRAVRLYKTYEDEDNVYLVQELCRGKTLLDYMEDGKQFTEFECAQVCFAVLEALASCHRQHVCYGDVKPANVMVLEPCGLCDRSHVKLIDFGCSQRCGEGQMLSQFTGTPRYMAPEVYLRSYGVQSDLWGLGVMMYEMLSGRHPLYESDADGSDPSKYQWTKWLLSKPLSFEGATWDNLSYEAIDLVKRLLDRNTTTRVSAEEALRHPWLARFGDAAAISKSAIADISIVSEENAECVAVCA